MLSYLSRVLVRTVVLVVASAALLAEGGANPQTPSSSRSLAGTWRFEMDRGDIGLSEGWFARDLSLRIQLPGVLQAQGFGDEISVDTPWVAALPRDMRWYLLPQYRAYTEPGHVKMPYLSQPVRHYLGVAWYQRDLDIDDSWKGKRVVLSLERPRWETTLWVDDRRLGSNRSLVAPHVYDLGTLAPGRHRITVRVDNRMLLPYRPDGHSVSDAEGQTWNGIVGAIDLSATTPVWLEDAQAYPNVAEKSVRIHVRIKNSSGRSGSGTITANTIAKPVQWSAEGAELDLELPLGPDAKEWSEFSPVLQRVALRLLGELADDSRELVFGLRQIQADGTRLVLNGGAINLRGTHDGGGFPLAGYPATDVESWKRIIGICKGWGLNMIRFHSWCPPKAAFIAADEMGFYLQPECGMWNAFGDDGKMLEILNDETERLLKEYGNHPSFLFLAATNEPAGRFKAQLPTWNKLWRERDPRRLFTDGSGRPATPANQPSEADFVVSADYGLSGRIRGPRGWFGLDYEAALAGVRLPVVTHELGQWCAYPNFAVIEKFTGYLRPGNYEIARDQAVSHGVSENNQQLAYASGRFQLACYKEEIEANLRTPSLSGFQLLDLHDYLGQGTALVGLLDAFWEEKGYATAKEFRRFCNATVPLARLRSRLFTAGETLTSEVEAAHFGKTPLAAIKPYWRIEDASGRVQAQGVLPERSLPIGKNIPLGRITVSLAKLPAPAAYKLVVGLRETGAENDWNFWVYPAGAPSAVPADILVTSVWPEAEKRLGEGGKVLFQPSAGDLDEEDPKLSTTPIFWNRLMNPEGTAFLGLWCDTRHPALAGFPTESYGDWQWIDLIENARALNLGRLPPSVRPIVQPIDDWNRNFKLGLIYECKVGGGRLLVCGVDLSASKPGVASLRKSLLDYMAQAQFRPSVEVSLEAMREQWASTRLGPRSNSFRPTQQQAPEIDAARESAKPRS